MGGDRLQDVMRASRRRRARCARCAGRGAAAVPALAWVAVAAASAAAAAALVWWALDMHAARAAAQAQSTAAAQAAQEAAQQAQRREPVLQLLSDPESARFAADRPGLQPGAWCGTVNARTPAGGYAGSRRYLIASGLAAIDGGPAADLEALARAQPQALQDEATVTAINAEVSAWRAGQPLDVPALARVRFAVWWGLVCGR